MGQLVRALYQKATYNILATILEKSEVDVGKMNANDSTYNDERSELEGRAIVPPVRYRISKDVVSAASINPRSSPSPFALAVYTLNEADGLNESSKPLDLFFVSNRASDDRCWYKNVCDLSGVLPGWYAISEPDRYYEVRHRRMNTHMPNFRGRYNIILTRLYVDGIPASRTTLYDIETHGTAIYDQVDVGFDVGTELSPTGVPQKCLKRFCFRRTNVSDLSHSELASGTIHLRVKVGERAPLAPGGNWGEEGRWRECVNPRPIPGQAVEKEGRSLQTTGTSTVNQIWLQSDVSAINVRSWSEADVVVHVREAAWMRSRRLIDDNGKACTHMRLKAWLEEASLKQEVSMEELHIEEKPPVQKDSPK